MFYDNSELFKGLDVSEKAWKRKQKAENSPLISPEYNLIQSPGSEQDSEKIERKNSTISQEETLFSQIDRKNSLNSDDSLHKVCIFQVIL
jgi:hypothetical protein